LADKNAWALPVLGVILDHDGTRRAVEHFTNKDTIFGHLVIAVRGNPHVFVLEQLEDPP
jgi:hypothetical protein